MASLSGPAVTRMSPPQGGHVTIVGSGALFESLLRVTTASWRPGHDPAPPGSGPGLGGSEVQLCLVVLDDDPGDPAGLPDRVAAFAPPGQCRLAVVRRGDVIEAGPLDGTEAIAGFEGTAGLTDLAGRLIAAAGRRPPAREASRTRPVRWDDAELAWVADLLEGEIRQFFRGRPGRTVGHLAVLDPRLRSVRCHPVLPLPSDRDPVLGEQAPDAKPRDVADVMDPKTGIVTGIYRLRHHPSIPHQVTTMHATIANMRRISPWMTDPVAGGSAFGNPEAAFNAALGEALERYSGEIIQRGRLCFASWTELTADGENALDPRTLVLFSQKQYETPGFPFVPLTRDLPVHWVSGRCLSSNQPAWLPASLVYPNWYTGEYAADSHTNNPFYPGLAAGKDLDSALASAIQEVVERHATMVWWANAHALPAVRQPSRLKQFWAGEPARYGQRAWLIHIDNEFGVPVFAGMLENTQDQLFTMGFAARPDPEAAALKAWTEALTLQEAARDMLDPNGARRQAIEAGHINGRFLKPWRADRRYLDDYRDDFRDVVDLMCQVQIHLDPRAPDRVRPWADTPEDREFGELGMLPDGSLASYRRAVESRGYRIFYADTTTHDVARTGIRVVRVLIPGLVPNFAAAFPFHGLGRLRETAVELGWRRTPMSEDDINMFPMAHA